MLKNNATLKTDVSAYLKELQGLFDQMDRQYDDIAQAYGFQCAGCENNCCYSRFYHHSVLEYLYLLKGVMTLSVDKQSAVRSRAAETVRAFQNANEKVRLLCPLNDDERCIIYDFRPMICRLHGLPHELSRPGDHSNKNYGPGCEVFERQFGHMTYRKFDRTPLYKKMALLEKAYRDTSGFSGKIKMTVAEMILEMFDEDL
jgi:Fe-S-cluster containining protein